MPLQVVDASTPQQAIPLTPKAPLQSIPPEAMLAGSRARAGAESAASHPLAGRNTIMQVCSQPEHMLCARGWVRELYGLHGCDSAANGSLAGRTTARQVC